MKAQIFTLVLVLMSLSVHCIPVFVNYNAALPHPYRVPHAMVIVGYAGQPMIQHRFVQVPQFNTKPLCTCVESKNNEVPNEEVLPTTEENVEQDLIQQTTPSGTETTVEDSITEASKADSVVTQNPVPESPAKENPQPESDEDDYEDDDEEEDILNLAKSGINFFPVVFGSGGSKGRSGGFAGTVAIANSFSTGRRGVASSNANASNDPPTITKKNDKN